MAQVNTYAIRGGEAFPYNPNAGDRCMDLDTLTDYVFAHGKWNAIGQMQGIEFVTDENGMNVVVVDNLRVKGYMAAEEASYQSLNGMNGALMIAPSGRVKNITNKADRLLPTAHINDADYVTDAQALLSGTIQPNGVGNGELEYYFEYSEDLSLEIKRTEQLVVIGEGVVRVEAVIKGLTASKQYTVVLHITRGYTDYRTNAVKFTTMPTKTIPALVPVVITAAPTLITSEGVTLHGNLTEKTAALTYYFKLWTADGSYQIKTASADAPSGTLTAVSLAVTGLPSSTAFYCALCVTDGTTTWSGNQVQFTTLAALSEASRPMAGVTVVSSIGGESATFTATVTPSGVPVTYQFEWWSSSASVRKSTIQSSSSSSPVTATHTEVNLKPLRDYFVQVAVFYDDEYGPEPSQQIVKLLGATATFTTTDV